MSKQNKNRPTQTSKIYDLIFKIRIKKNKKTKKHEI